MSEPYKHRSDQRSALISVERLKELVEAALLRVGANQENVTAIAQTIVASERDGVRSHGLLRLPGIVHSIEIGWADGRAQPRIITEAPGLLVVDAQRGFAQIALAYAKSKVMSLARTSGSVVLLIRNSHHFAALWPDVEPFAIDGFVALSCVNSKKRMAAWSGGRAVTGTNAIAFATPRPGCDPLVWDQSSSVLSQGDVLLAAQQNRNVPLGVGCDASGRPTTSPAEILNGGALLPFGGPKGASLAVMVEVLSAALTGGPFGFEDRSPSGNATTSLGGYFLLVIDPRKSGSEFYERIGSLCDALVDAGSARLPGDRRYSARKRALSDGIEIDSDTYAKLLGLAAERSTS